jgi:hypothetical protein
MRESSVFLYGLFALTDSSDASASARNARMQESSVFRDGFQFGEDNQSASALSRNDDRDTQHPL